MQSFKGVSFQRNCGAAFVGEYCSDEGLTLEMSAFLLLTVASLCFMLSSIGDKHRWSLHLSVTS